jgi:hypothetical protein
MFQQTLRVQRVHNLNFVSTPAKGQGTLNPGDYKIGVSITNHYLDFFFISRCSYKFSKGEGEKD